MHIGYPFFVNSFPNVQEYITYFKTLAEGMVLFVKSAITPNNPNYGAVDSTVNAFMTGKTRVNYLTEKTQMLQTIIDSIVPDYLCMENEPTTMEASSGLAFSFAPDSVADFLTYYVSNLTNNSIQLGAGAGTWEELNYFDKMSDVDNLDFIDFHIYPVFNDLFAAKLVERCELVSSRGAPYYYPRWLC